MIKGVVRPQTLQTPASAHPSSIFAILRAVHAAATVVGNEIDKAYATEHVERQVLEDLHESVENLKCNIMAYEVLLGAMQKDPGRFYEPEWMEDVDGMGSLKTALRATQLVLDKGIRHRATMKPSDNNGPRRALRFVLNVLTTNFQLEDLHGLIDYLKDTTDEIFVCQQNNGHAFKPIWYNYVAEKQWRDSTLPVGNLRDIQDRVWWALNSLHDAFHIHPFAVSPENIRRASHLPIFAILNHNHEAATRHQERARQIGKAWVDDRYHPHINVIGENRIQQLSALQISLFELLWSEAVEQMKRESPYSLDDPEQPEFERAVGELEKVLQKAIVRLREPRFTIAFCGTVEADKSSFLNALMGRAILPSDGESHDPRMPRPILSIITESLSTAFPCRLRHVKGQNFPQLIFQAEPFLVALKKLQAHQYGLKMQTYQPPPEINMFEELLLSDTLSGPSDDEILLRAIHSQWVKLHAVTRENLLKFETPEFELPRGAHGDLDVKTLVSSMSCWTALCSTERHFS